MIRGVLFDLDGTLVDSYEAIAESLNYALHKKGLPPRTVQEVRRMVGGGVHEVVRKAAGERYVEEGVRLFREHYTTILAERTLPLPGALETLAELHRRGYRLGLGTNKPSDFARRILAHLGMDRTIRAMVGPAEVDRPKPDPAMLLSLLKTLDLGPDEAVYVGDMPIDAETARRAGVAVWLLPTGSATEEEVLAAGPDRFLRSLGEMLEHLPAVLPCRSH